MLSIARDANQAALADDGAATAGADGGGGARGVEPCEFYSDAISRNVDLRAQYEMWSQQSSFSLLSAPWLLNVEAKARLLRFEAQVRQMHVVGRTMLHVDDDEHFGEAMAQIVLGASAGAPSAGASASASASASGPDDGPPAKRVARGALAADAPPPPDPSLPVLLLHVRRDHVIADALNHLTSARRSDMLKSLRVIFVGEPGIDEGGVRKEFFQLLVEQARANHHVTSCHVASTVFPSHCRPLAHAGVPARVRDL